VHLAYRTHVGSPTTKSVFVCLCDAGCNACGLAFPGVPAISGYTELSPTSVRKALESLAAQGLAKPVRYLNGGRGVATEYLLFHGHKDLSTAPCAECRKNMRNPPPPGGYDKALTDKPTARRRVSEKTHHFASENPSRGGDQQSVTDTTVSTEESSPPARRVTSDPTDTPDPTDWEYGRAQAAKLAEMFGVVDDPPSSRDGT